jgi:hypothetical protein
MNYKFITYNSSLIILFQLLLKHIFQSFEEIFILF